MCLVEHVKQLIPVLGRTLPRGRRDVWIAWSVFLGLYFSIGVFNNSISRSWTAFNNCVMCICVYEPAVLVVGEHVTLVLDAGHGVGVAVAGREHLVGRVVVLPPALRVLRPVVPHQRHHHLAWTPFISIIRYVADT